MLLYLQDSWEIGISTLDGKAPLDKKELQGGFGRVISVLAGAVAWISLSQQKARLIPFPCHAGSYTPLTLI